MSAKKKHQSLRMFESDLMESLSHVHPSIPAIMWLPVVTWLTYRSFALHALEVSTFAVLGLFGFLTWTLTEYALHRWVFHFGEKSQNKLAQRFHFIVHGNHHEDAVDPSRLVMPPAPAAILAVLLFGLFRTFLGPIWVEPFFAMFLVGYLSYDYIHYYVHHFIPKNPVGKFLKQNHMLHHYATNGARWGVSSPLWDYIFGTIQDKKARSS